MDRATLILGTLILGLFACGGAATDPDVETGGAVEAGVAPAGRIAYESRVLERESAGCDEPVSEEGEAPPCAEVRLTWPRINGAPSREAADRLQGWILDTLLLAPMGEEPAVESPEAFADEFLAEFEAYRAEFPDAPGGWADERTIEIIYQDPDVVSFRSSEYVYTGGAHPNSAVALVSFDPRSGRPLRLEELFVEGYREPLRQIAERRFREARGVPPSESLEEAGFWFEDGFALNANWAIDDPGVLFHWDPYEVAAYAAGPTEIVLTLADLEDLVDPEGPLSR